MARRSSGAAASRTMPVVPLKTAPAPAPMSAPDIRNSARLGLERRTEVTSRTRPTSIEVVPSARTREPADWWWPAGSATPQENTRNSVAPARACEGCPSVVARKRPESPANSPIAENAARVAAAAGTGSRGRRGPARRLAEGAACPGGPVSGSGRQPEHGDRPECDEHQVGQGQRPPAHWARQPAMSGPTPERADVDRGADGPGPDNGRGRVGAELQLDQVGDGGASRQARPRRRSAGGRSAAPAGPSTPRAARRPPSWSPRRRASRLCVRPARRSRARGRG